MLRSEALKKNIELRFSYILGKRANLKQLDAYLTKNYNYPATEYMQFVLGARTLDLLDDEKLYWILDGINSLKISEKIPLEKYYSDLEIRKYSTQKYVEKTIEKYPVVLEGIKEINNDQWFLVADVNLFKELYDKQLIVYNPNTQRQLKKTSNGYKIDVNNKSVKEIEKLLENDEFISNDLSFNLSIDNPNVEFDIVGDKIIITNGQLDIIDGFHRFRAAMNVKKRNPEFNYNFGMKIMNFDEAKANTYIGQEDKRNKISVVHSKSLDATNPVNIIVERVSKNPNSSLKGLVGTEGTAPISRAFLFGAIDYYYKVSDCSRSEIARKSNHIINVFNNCMDAHPEFVDGISKTDLVIIVYGSTLSDDAEECFEKIDIVLKMDNKPKVNNAIVKKTVSKIESLFY